MKILKYNLCTYVNYGTEEKPHIKAILSPVTMSWNETNEEIAKREAYEGKYSIEDDGQVEDTTPTAEERLAALESAMLELILGGVTE